MMTQSNDLNKTIFHLTTLRGCLLRCLYTVVILFAILFYFSSDLFNWLAGPLLRQLPNNYPMIATSLTSTFVAPMKLAFFASIYLSMPIIFWQIWRFITPALYKTERYMIWPLLFASVALFYAGITFAYFIVFPLLFRFFISVLPDSITLMPDITSYINFSLKLFFAFGLAFEVPIVTLLCIWSSWFTIESLKAKRAYVFVVAFVVGMLLTPPDVISQILLAVPLYLLFEAGILLGRYLPSPRTAEKFEAESH